MTGDPFILFLFAFAAAALLMPAARVLALRAGFVDKPGGRKKHEDPVPPVGGLVVFPVFTAAALWAGAPLPIYGWFFAALALLLVTGVYDDAKGVKARTKFMAQFIAALLIVIPGQAQINMLGDLFGFGPLGLRWLAIPFSVIAVVLLINAVNLMDGLDGLAGGNGLIVMLWLAIASFAAGADAALLAVAALMGALGGFLVYNLRRPLRRKASVFLGDAGSMALGLALAWFCIRLGRGFEPAIEPIGIAWLLALPIYDTCGQFARRISQGRHPFDADHDHFHHHFIYAGFSTGQATAIILALIFVTGLIGVGGLWLGLPEAALTYPWIALLFAHIYMSLRPHRFRRLVARLRPGKVADE